MKPLSLLFLGVVVGWAASGVDWSREAIGEETDSITGKPVLPLIQSEVVDENGNRTVAIGQVMPASIPGRYKAITRVQIEKLGGRQKVDGIIGADDLKYLTAGLNALAADGRSLVTIEQAHQYTIAGPAGSSITTPATYIFERR